MKKKSRLMSCTAIMMIVVMLASVNVAFAGITRTVVDLDAKGRTQQITETHDRRKLSDQSFSKTDLNTQAKCVAVVNKFAGIPENEIPWYVSQITSGFRKMIFEASGLGVATRVTVTSQKINVFHYDTVTKKKTLLRTTEKINYNLYKGGKLYKTTKLTCDKAWGSK